MDSHSAHSDLRNDERKHYEVEVELAGRLRRASKEQRLEGLYASIYNERLERIPTHPLLVRAGDAEARDRASSMQLRLLAPLLTPRMVFLEVGPGDCALALAVASRVKCVYAVDVSNALAGEERSANFHLVSSNGVDIPVPPSSVDLAYSNQVLEHLHPDDAYDHLRSIYRALVPGGRFICITPNRLSGPWDISRHFDTTATGLHLKEYTISEEVDLLAEVGFTVSLFSSYYGFRILSLPKQPVRAFESFLEALPRRVRRPAASCLAAIKVMATKPADTN
jgi:SAM-dependent methyltransferase